MTVRIDWRRNLREPRFIVLAVAAAMALVAALAPSIPARRPAVDVLAVVDITGSMNTRDYMVDGRPADRLGIAKAALKRMIATLPCGSRFGLALFAERVSFLLFEPVEICGSYGALAGSIEAIDWREGWEGDSHIASGLFNAIETARDVHANLVFITDGQEAPPLPLSGGPVFTGTKGEVGGLIVGAGGYGLSPIPKFDERGHEIGFWDADEVPHESHFGVPPPNMAERPGYEPRNAPFGAMAPTGTEHLSSVREPYLQSLGAETGLAYLHLSETTTLTPDLLRVAAIRQVPGRLDLRFVPGSLALVLLIAAYAAPDSRRRLRFPVPLPFPRRT